VEVASKHLVRHLHPEPDSVFDGRVHPWQPAHRAQRPGADADQRPAGRAEDRWASLPTGAV